MKGINSRIAFVLAALAFKLSLDVGYVFYLNAAFNDHFLTPFVLEISPFRLLESYFWVVIAASFLPYGVNNLSGAFFSTALVFLYIPLATMLGMDAGCSRLTILLAAVALGVSSIISSIRLIPIRVPVPSNGQLVAVTVCWFGVIYFLVLSFITGALFRMNFDAASMYMFRAEHDELINSGLLGYVNLWVQKILTPFLLAVYLHRRSWLMVVVCCMLFVVYFGVTQHRFHLFVPLLVFLVWYLYSRKWTFSIGLLLLAGGVFASTLAGVLGYNDLAAVLLRRAFFVGASVTTSWVEYFSVNPKVYFSDGLLSGLISTKYTGLNIPYFLGDYFRPGLNLSFNAGFIATGYAHCGLLGVLLYSVIIGGFIRVVNAVIRGGVHPFLPVAIMFSPLRTAWADSDLLTAFLSHGLAVGLVMLWLYGGGVTGRTSVNVHHRDAEHKQACAKA